MQIPGEVFWPTAAFGSLIALIFGGIGFLRWLPSRKSRELEGPGRETQDQLDHLQQRMGELEERVDFAERLLASRRESEKPRLPGA